MGRKVLLVNSNKYANELAEFLLEGREGIEEISSATSYYEACLRLDELRERREKKALVLVSSEIHNGHRRGYVCTSDLCVKASEEGHIVILYSGRKQKELSDKLKEALSTKGIPHILRTIETLVDLYEAIKPYL